MPTIPERHGLLDIFRLLAIFGVICLHQSVEESQHLNFGTVLRLMFRWCVPFFFLLTGFFLPNQGGFPDIKMERIKRIVLITLLANLMYLPLALVLNGIAALDTSVFAVGFYFHLWFLNAMIFGLLVVAVLPSLLRNKTLINLFCILLLVAYFAADIFFMTSELSDHQLAFARYLSAIAFIWIGFQLGVNKACLPGWRFALAMVSIGLIECLAEAFLLSSMGYSQLNRQFPLGVPFAAVGIILLGCKPSQNSLGVVEKIGREATLPLYIIHPIFLKLANILVAKGIAISNDALSFSLVVLLAFFGSLSFYLLLNKFLPSIANLLNGRLPSPPQNVTAI